MNIDSQKGFRLLNLYERLNSGECINKKDFAAQFNISEKSVQRDIDDLRAYLSERYETGDAVTVGFNKAQNAYHLIKNDTATFNESEIVSLIKILLESRAFNKEELSKLINKLLEQVPRHSKHLVKELTANEQLFYVPLQHGKNLLQMIWTLSTHINSKHIISFSYIRQDGVHKMHRVKPVSIMFSEFYFYLVCFMVDKELDYPTIFRIDRMENVSSDDQVFAVPYGTRFQEGEFRKRVQFMYSGELKTVAFEYHGPTVEAVLDRLPTAKILSYKDNVYTISAESYGNGIDMWLNSQGSRVTVLPREG